MESNTTTWTLEAAYDEFLAAAADAEIDAFDFDASVSSSDLYRLLVADFEGTDSGTIGKIY